jgi:Zn-dependent protease with chaperone function
VSYGSKLACLSLAAFFIVHCAAAMAASIAAPLAIRMAGRMRAGAATRFLLTVRFAPAAIALLVVAALCVPSYLSFEPQAAAEQASTLCLLLALLCASVWAISLARGARAIWRSRDLRGFTVALAGLLRPRVLVSPEVRRALSPEELAAALRHEQAHAASHDNLKRLLMLLAPDLFPFFRGGFANLERTWKKFAEWSADDRAVNGDAERSLALASALVRVARLGSAAPAAPLVTCLTDGDLAARIDRLLHPAPDGRPDRWTPAVCALGGIAFAAAILQPAVWAGVYEILERLIR